ncbi:MAG: class I SAM-dependent methyltransferase [Acidimicrobiales bacterium]
MATASNDPAVLVPNHHGHHRGFSGISGWIAALSMRSGRTGDAELALSLTGVVSGRRVVDIGCGPGVAARLAAARGAEVTGVDPSGVMLSVARRDDRRRTVTWAQGAAENLPLADNSVDVAWSLSTVHHWPDLDAGLAEVRRVLAGGGCFLATERCVKPGATGLASHGWTTQQAESFAALCTSAGFHDVRCSSHETKRGLLVAVLAHTSD